MRPPVRRGGHAPPAPDLLGRAGRIQGLDDLVGDVHAAAGEHHFLQDHVVLLGIEDLLDDAVGALDDAGQLLVLALVQVFLEFAALALDVAVLIDQFALPAATLGFSQRRGFLLQLVGRGLESGFGLRLVRTRD